MKLETKIAYLILCLALPLTTACKKTPIPAEDPQPAEIGFTAASQAVEMKSGTKATTPLSQFHQDFGVWGIATNTLSPQYILWDDNNLTKVERQGDTDVYVPTSPAYWFNNYTYYFMALAPFNSGATNFDIHSANHTMSFNFNLGSKYSTALEFDLMGAVAHKEVETTKPANQNLVFWHLFAKINIAVSFVDGSGAAITTGSVSEMRLNNVDTEATYTLSFNNNNELAVACVSNSAVTTPLTFSSATASFNILPQNITDFQLYLDFTLNGVEYKDFKVNLNAAGNPTTYNYNERYNWNITIGPKEDISFKVTVEPWVTSEVSDGDSSDDNNDIEII